MPGRCRFYEFQKAYLKKLVELKYVVIDLEAGLGEEEEKKKKKVGDLLKKKHSQCVLQKLGRTTWN